MGVPAFYRWLSDRYPKIMVDAIEEEPEVIGATEIPVDITQPNPNCFEVDNLYLDMNGIIHPCFHPEDSAPPTTESEVFQNIFDYVDRLVAIVRPRRLLYLAIDGVAPRAKMNQQRSRRFRAAEERQKHAEIEAEMREKLRQDGIQVVEGLETNHGDAFDSNVITPGTEFMDRLATALNWYVHERLNNRPGWSRMSIILSDANTPGEGEHKFMQFVREQRDVPGWNSNTSHCIYGLDADLIHLALASHEPHFYILRDVITYTKNMAGNSRKGDMDIRINIDRARTEIKAGAGPDPKIGIKGKPFQFMRINVLRDYLKLEFEDLKPMLRFPFDGERVVDDFVFMCFFVGNDFLPHMPTLDIKEQGIELMLHVYREQLPLLEGFLASGSQLHLDRVEQFIMAVGAYEDNIFQARMRKLRAEMMRYKQRKNEEVARREAEEKERNAPLEALAGDDNAQNGDAGHHSTNQEAAAALREQLGQKRKAGDGSGEGGQPSKRPTPTQSGGEGSKRQQMSEGEFREGMKSKLKGMSDMFEKMVEGEDQIRLGETGWRRRYYAEKFGDQQQNDKRPLPNQFKLETDDDYSSLIAGLRKSYVEGLQWVMHYYYDGVASWRWYYPYHYAPFASDLVGMKDMQATFELGEPFDPFNQLMGVLPPASGHAVPEPLRRLFEANSKIADFYPDDFKTDQNGKRYAWQGVALLKFIEEDRLLEQTNPIIAELPERERKRNERRAALLMVRSDVDAGEVLLEFARGNIQACSRFLHAQKADYSERVFQELGFSGRISRCPAIDPCPASVRPPEFGTFGVNLHENVVVQVNFEDPPHKPHQCVMLSLNPPTCNLTARDLPAEKPLWCMQHELRNMQRNAQRSASQPARVAPGGHRMVQHHLPSRDGHRGGRGGQRDGSGGYRTSQFPNRGPRHSHSQPPPPGRGYHMPPQMDGGWGQGGYGAPAVYPGGYAYPGAPQQQMWDPNGAGAYGGHGGNSFFAAMQPPAQGYAYGAQYGGYQGGPPQGHPYNAHGGQEHGGYGRRSYDESSGHGGHWGGPPQPQHGRGGHGNNRFAPLRDSRQQRHR